MTLTLAEAADLLKLSGDALLRKARAGTVPGARIGRRWVFSEADLLAFIRSLYRQPIPVDRRFNAKANYATGNRRAALLLRTPAWVNLADVYGVYVECARHSLTCAYRLASIPRHHACQPSTTAESARQAVTTSAVASATPRSLPDSAAAAAVPEAAGAGPGTARSQVRAA